MPSSSARCAQFPRAQDKVHYYIKLKDLRDQLRGFERNTDVQEVRYTFDLQLAQGERARAGCPRLAVSARSSRFRQYSVAYCREALTAPNRARRAHSAQGPVRPGAHRI